MPFIVYSASAGSGKTYTLVNEYLSLTLPDPSRFPRVLAVTFTNKAAAQMKERILEALAEMRQGKDSERLAALSETTGLSREELIRRSGQLLTSLLHQYGDYAVMTIDSFILRVVRAFSFDLGLPLRFEVELSQERVTALLVERIIAQAREGHRIGDILTRFILEKIYYQHNWDYEKEILGIAGQRFNDRSLYPINELLELPDSVLDELEKNFSEWLAVFEKTVRSLSAEIITEIRGKDLPPDAFAYGKAGIYSQIEKLSKAHRKEDYDIKSRLRKGEWFSKTSPLKTRHQGFLDDTLEPLRQKMVDFIDDNIPRFHALWDIRRSLPTLRLLKEFELELENLGQSDRLVPISQFNRKVARIIEKEGIPYIYLRIGEHFQNYLIDEFQDTNRLQWNNLFPLIENALAEGGKNLVVGDPKQSIYRWRGGDPSIMEKDIPVSFPPGTVEHRRLESNFRSLSAVVEFNNLFFADFSSEPDFPGIERFSAARVRQKAALRSSRKGQVEIRFFSGSEKKKIGAEETQAAVRWAVDHIRKAREEGLNYRDMAVLVRWRKDAVPIAEALIEEEIPVVTSDSLQLAQYRVVRAVVAVLAYLHHRDPLQLTEIAAYFRGDAFPSFLAELPDSEKTLAEVKSHLPGLDRWLEQTTALSLYDLTEEVCAAFAPLSSAAPLLSFLDLVFLQSPRMNGDLGTFLEWWQENKQKESTLIRNCQSPDSVQILTIHKAKGLEFPLVILPFADWEIIDPNKNRSPELWVYDNDNRLGEGPLPYLVTPKNPEKHLFGREIEEERQNDRIDSLHELYVSFTRARSRLLVGARCSFPGLASSWIRSRLDTIYPQNSGRDIFAAGEPDVEVTGDGETTTAASLPAQPFNSWQNRLLIRAQAAEEWLDPKDPRTEGKLFHRLLSKIYHEKDLTPVLDWASESGLIDEAQRRIIAEHIERLFDLPLFGETVRSHFQPPWQVRTEATILDGPQNLRPDRIQFLHRQIRVIDYKRELPHSDHSLQLGSYIRRLNRAYPGYRLRGALLYLISGTIVEADPEPATPGGPR